MDLGLKGQTAIVAAASKGLGRAVALGLAREGCNVTIFSRDEGNIRAAADEIRAAGGGDVLALVADVTRAADIDRVVKATLDRFGEINVLYVNAGGPPPGLFEELSDEQWQQAFELNLLSAVRLTRATLPALRAAGGGSIIYSTSITVKQPGYVPRLILSNSIRSGVTAMAKTLADELARDNIRVNSVAPGRIWTERVQQLDEARAAREGRDVEDVRREQEATIPLGRYGQPEEFANAVVFLASRAASYITGVTLLVDGGVYRGLF